MKIESEVGKGTSVKIYFPRFTGAAGEEPVSAGSIASRNTGTETILVVEDDAEVREFSVAMLRGLGYQTLHAADGDSALKALGSSSRPVDLLFSDVVLPGGMNGAALAARAMMLCPSLKVLYTTGYAREALVHGGRLDPGVELLGKPFTHDELAHRVREVLDKPRPA